MPKKNLNQHLNDYLKFRRQLGYKLKEAEFFLRNFIRFIEQEGTGVITAKLAVRWATRPNLKPAQNGSPLSVVRRFAAYVSAHDARTEIPAQKLLPYHLCRRDPYHYTDDDVEAHLPALATYLGHVHVRDSYWYLSAVPELLKLATFRWERAEKGVA